MTCIINKPNTITTMKKLTKSNNKTLCGVCGGIAEYFELDPTLVRVGYCALSIFSAGFPGILLYVVMALVMPGPDSKYLN